MPGGRDPARKNKEKYRELVNPGGGTGCFNSKLGQD